MGRDTMLRADFRRMLTSSYFYVMTGIAFVMPILILVMTTMAGDAEGFAFTNTWQIIANTSDAGMLSMDMTAMCNINLIYFLAAVFVCLFVSEEFKSGFAKNIFAIRSRRGGYVFSKTLVCFIGASVMLIAFFIGSVFGGAFAGLSLSLGAAGVFGLVMCMLSKIFLMAVFVGIFLTMSVIAKQRAWFSMLLSLFAGMLLFMMVPMLTPLDAGPGSTGMCLAGGVIFAAAMGVISRVILERTGVTD